MVVRKLLACTQSNGHETSTALWNSYCRVSSNDLRKYASAEEHTRKTTARHFGFTKKVYGLPFSATPQQHNTVQNSIGIVGMSFMVRIYYSSGSSLKAGCLC